MNYNYKREHCIDARNLDLYRMVDCGIVRDAQTPYGASIDAAGGNPRYDYNSKKLLSEKIILAWILKYCVPEFEGYSVQEIASNYIEGEYMISRNAVFPDEDYDAWEAMNAMGQIHGLQNEDVTSTEGMVRYDIRFNAYIPGLDAKCTLFVNIEAQNKFHTGYPLTKRGIYYGSRMISSQYGKDFVNSNYGEIHKVYSIWICSNPPKKRENTITRYRITEENVIGEVKEEEENYDLMQILMVCLGDSEDTNEELLRLLDTLFVDAMTAKEKKQRLVEEFQIAINDEMDRGIEEMCDFSQGIEDRGMRRGLEKGLEKGLILLITKKIQKSKPLEIIADELECEVEEIRKMYEVIKKLGVESSMEEIMKELR